MNHDPKHVNRLGKAYAKNLLAQVERTCVKRIEEIEGRVPSLEEVAQCGHSEVSEQSGIALYRWKGEPICEFVAARLTHEGWQAARINEIRSMPSTQPTES